MLNTSVLRAEIAEHPEESLKHTEEKRHIRRAGLQRRPARRGRIGPETNQAMVIRFVSRSDSGRARRFAAPAEVRLQWRHDREVEVLSRQTLSGLYPTITASLRGDVGSNHWGVTSP